MERITHWKHPKQAYLFTLSRTLERASYYGMRSILILFLVKEIFVGDDGQASIVYGTFTGALILGKILGAFLGDLLIGNRRSIILGAIIQALGIFTLCIPSTTSLYIGMGLMVLGGGLFSTNMTAEFGKSYLQRIKLLDSGFSLLYMGINLGSFIGVVLISMIAETLSFTAGFIGAGVLSILSALPLFFIKKSNLCEETHVETHAETHVENHTDSTEMVESPDIIGTPADLGNKSAPDSQTQHSSYPIANRVINIIVAIFGVGLFWSVYEMGSEKSYEVIYQLSQLPMGVGYDTFSTMGTMFTIPLTLFAFVLWSFFYVDSKIRMLFGFLSAAIGFGILYLIPPVAKEPYILYFVAYGFFLSLAEMYLGPTVYSIVTKYGNPKYLAILGSGIYASNHLFGMLVNPAIGLWAGQPNTLVLTAIIVSVILAILGIVWIQIDKATARSRT